MVSFFERVRKYKNIIYLGATIILVASLSIYHKSRYDKIMSEQSFTVCRTTKLTMKNVFYKFEINSVEFNSDSDFQDPDSTNKIGTYYLLLYYPKDPTINSIMYQEVRDSVSYGKEISYPYKVKVNFWRFQ